MLVSVSVLVYLYACITQYMHASACTMCTTHYSGAGNVQLMLRCTDLTSSGSCVATLQMTDDPVRQLTPTDPCWRTFVIWFPTRRTTQTHKDTTSRRTDNTMTSMMDNPKKGGERGVECIGNCGFTEEGPFVFERKRRKSFSRPLCGWTPVTRW